LEGEERRGGEDWGEEAGGHRGGVGDEREDSGEERERKR